MNCERMGELLSALADGELAGPMAWRVRRHAQGCARCAAELAALQHTRAALRRLAVSSSSPARRAGGSAGVALRQQSQPAPVNGHFSPTGASCGDAPPDFWAAVSRRLDGLDAAAGARARPVRRPRFRWLAPWALLALIMTLVLLWIPRQPPVASARIVAWQAQPLLSGPGRRAFITASPSDASAWLSRRLGRPIPPVDLELVGLDPRGALAWTEAGRTIGLLRYQRGRESWSLLVVPGAGELEGSQEIVVGRQPFQTSATSGLQLAAWHSGESLIVLAGPDGMGELLRAARQAARACEIER